MNAELIAVGSELLKPGFSDTNSQWIAERLARIGITLRRITLVGDDEERIAATLGVALGQAEVVVLTGGLGPTEDDRTRGALARALGAPLERDPAMALRIEERVRARGRAAFPELARQADLPHGARFIENPLGSAPGIASEYSGCLLFALPGVPAEMKSMFTETVLPALRARATGALARRTLKLAGRTESSVDRQLRDLYASPAAEVTILARSSGIELLLETRGETRAEAESSLADLERAIVDRLGEDVFGRDDETLAAVVGESLLARGATLAVAESCTAGLLAAAITTVPGSSTWFRGGLVVYADDLKQALAGVAESTLREHGAVSAAVACELARGARSRCGAEFGIGITGIAGPGGGSEEKPVGLVHVCLDDEHGSLAQRFELPGDRELIRARTVTLALDLLRRRLRTSG